METPKSSSKCNKVRKHHPTPKMSDRKKSLFTPKSCERSSSLSYRCDSDNDSNLGMSPLQCSSSSSNYDSDDSAGSTTYTDILKSNRKDDYRNRFSDSGKYEFMSSKLTAVPETTNEQTPTKLNLSNAWIDISQIEDFSAPITLLTPCGTSTKEKAPKTSFRKALIDKDLNKTPNVEVKFDKTMEEEKDPKARTSLFSDGAISTKSFYSQHDTSKGSLNDSFLSIGRRSKIVVHRANKPKPNRSYRTKKRNDINRGVFHKIQKLRTKKTKAITKKSTTKMTNEQLLEAAIDIIDSSPLNSYLNSSSNTEEDIKKRKRVQVLLKNMTNPIELARPLNITVPQIDLEKTVNNDYDDKLDIGPLLPLLPDLLSTPDASTSRNNKENNRKFFKSNTKKLAKYEVMKGISAILNEGKLSLEKPVEKPKKRKLRSLFDDDDDVIEFGEEQQEVNDILKTLAEPQIDDAPLKEIIRNVTMSPTTTQISSLASKFAASSILEAESKEKIYPLFDKGKKNKTFNSEPEPKRVKVNEWRSIGDDQLQIDAGQKAYGATECKTCGFIYTQHVPEDEQLHQHFHNSCQILNFKGWEKENVISEIYEWGVSGRIISVSNLDTKSKVQRTQEILNMADMELGFAQIPLHPSAIIYLACNNREIMGLCVAQPLYEANKLIGDFGIDFCSTETYPVKCGISRIWTNSKHRRKGVATKLFEAVKSHFIYGCRLRNDEIAFSAPTDMGKTFAEKVIGKKDILVYQ